MSCTYTMYAGWLIKERRHRDLGRQSLVALFMKEIDTEIMHLFQGIH